MHSLAGADKELGLVEGTQHKRELGAAQTRLDMPRVVGVVNGFDRRIVIVTSPAKCGLQLHGPVHRGLGEDADAALVDLVAANIGEEGALVRVGEAEIDRIVPCLNAERRLGG